MSLRSGKLPFLGSEDEFLDHKGRCTTLWNEHVRNVRVRYVQADEIWTYVGKKDKHVRVDDPDEFGNQWVFVAMDEETKFIPSFMVGKRTAQTTYEFLTDLQQRIADARFQLTTDGFNFYIRGVETCSLDRLISHNW
jgi:IS1 family transposase